MLIATDPLFAKICRQKTYQCTKDINAPETCNKPDGDVLGMLLGLGLQDTAKENKTKLHVQMLAGRRTVDGQKPSQHLSKAFALQHAMTHSIAATSKAAK